MSLESKYGFFDTIAKQRIWEFLRQAKGKKITTLELSKSLNLPQSTTNRALNELQELGLLRSETEGKFKYFVANSKVVEDIDHAFDYLENVRRFTLEQRKKRGVVERSEQQSTS